MWTALTFSISLNRPTDWFVFVAITTSTRSKSNVNRLIHRRHNTHGVRFRMRLRHWEILNKRILLCVDWQMQHQRPRAASNVRCCRLIRRSHRHTSMHKISTGHMVHHIRLLAIKLTLHLPVARTPSVCFMHCNQYTECVIESAGLCPPHTLHTPQFICDRYLSVPNVPAAPHRNMCAEHNLSIFVSYVSFFVAFYILLLKHSGYAKTIYFFVVAHSHSFCTLDKCVKRWQ